VYCQIEVSATGRSLVQWSPTECDLETLTRRKPRPSRAGGPREKESSGQQLFTIGKKCGSLLGA